MKVSSREFEQNVERYQDAAQRALVAITKDGRTHSVPMSASFFELVMNGRVARKVEDLDDETIAAISQSEVAPEHAHLDELIKDWVPDASKAASGPCDRLLLPMG